MERRLFWCSTNKKRDMPPSAGIWRSHIKEARMTRVSGLSLALVLVLILFSARPRTRAQSASKAGTPAPGATSTSAETPTLDYDFFKTRVEPIFLKKRPTHARCYVCHEEANHALKLAKLSPGNMTWTD